MDQMWNAKTSNLHVIAVSLENTPVYNIYHAHY